MDLGTLCFQVADKRKRDIAAFLRGLFLLAEEIAHSGMASVLLFLNFLFIYLPVSFLYLLIFTY
jgi:hypothetical protein